MNLPGNIQGLTTAEVNASRELHGPNNIQLGEDRVLLHVVKDVILEPMFILLVAACSIYLIVGQYREAIIMGLSILIVAGISFFQEYRSRNAVRALEKLSAPRATVIRNGKTVQVESGEVVVGDILLLEEGVIVPADGTIISANDFSLNESMLTGESFPVYKNEANEINVYGGTLVTSGSAVIRVVMVGNATMFGKIGLSLKEVSVPKTSLQLQVRSFVRNMVWIGSAAFLLVVLYNYFQSGKLVQAFLQGLTLAMSVLPEEIPVAFSTFQALGAIRLLRNHIIVKQPQYVETLGSATVICTDKTGTLTENRMSIEYIYDAVNKVSVNHIDLLKLPAQLTEYAMWASEVNPFDPMEKAIHSLYSKTALIDKRSLYEQVHEYPVGGKPPMMTHIFKNESGETIIAAKGAPEAILNLSGLDDEERKCIEEQALAYAKEGYRVLGVGKASWNEKHYPVSQQEFSFMFLGLLAFHDPPKKNIPGTIRVFHEAGIRVIMITGDHKETALAIARQIKLSSSYEVLTADDIIHMTDEELKQKLRTTDIFARMYPEAKLKVIAALKENGEVVAMTGDGVNDGPALKAAHVGIAMGKRGSEVAKNAASLILVDDDLEHMTTAVAIGRKIYDNLKKAIRYIVSIHIPIILIVTLPLLFMWKFTGIFTPVHVIFLELIMGPTCSIVYENEPLEPGTMQRAPRGMQQTFLSGKQLLVSILQGLMITAGCLGIGYYYLQSGNDNETVRTVIFITLLFSNVFLSFAGRSSRYTIIRTLRYRNDLLLLITGIVLLFIAGFLFVPFMRDIFGLALITGMDILECAGVAFVSVCWIELLKIIKARAKIHGR